MAGSRDQGPDSVRGRLEFPGWYRTFAKSYLAWANAPGDLKTPLLLQGAALATAESWLLAAPEKLSESQKRFIVRSIAQRAKGGGDGGPATAAGKRKKWEWRRASDRNLWQLYVVIGVGLWFFSPGIVRDVMERALNSPKVYQELHKGGGQTAQKPAAEGEPRTPQLADADSPEANADRETPPTNVAGAQGAAEPQPVKPPAETTPAQSSVANAAPAVSVSERLAATALEQLGKGDNRRALLVGIEAMDTELRTASGDSALQEKIALLLERAMTTRERLGTLAVRSATAETTMFCADARAVLAITSDEDVTVWKQGNARPAGGVKSAAPSLQGFAVDRDCGRALAPNEDFNVEVRQLATGKRVALLAGHEASILAASFSPDGASAVTASQDGSARIWDARTGRQRHLLSGHDWHVGGAEFSPDGRRVLTASADMTARIWDTQTGRQLLVLKGHQGVLNSARFVAGGSRVMTISWDGTARVWNAATGEQVHAFSQAGGITAAELNSRGDRLVTADGSGGIQIWDAATGTPAAAIAGQGDAVKALGFASADHSVAVLRWSGKLELIDSSSLKTRSVLSEEGVPVRDMRLSEGGIKLVAITEDGQRMTWPVSGSASAALAMARSAAPPCLSQDERATLGLEGEAPAWCAEVKLRGAALR